MKVGVIMGSVSDYEVMSEAVSTLEAFGVDFSVSDEIALSMGFSGDSSCRTEAGVLFELSHNEQSGGHVFLPREKLVAATAQLLDGDDPSP